MNIYCYVRNSRQGAFYCQLLKYICDRNDQVCYFTDNFLLFVYYRLIKGLKVSLLISFWQKREPDRDLTTREEKVLTWEIQVMKKKPQKVYRRYFKLINWFKSKIENGHIVGFCWGGNSTESYAFSQAIQASGGRIIYGEITNYPQTVYLEKGGTNYFSDMRFDLCTVDCEGILDPKFSNELRDRKKSQKKLPQSSVARFHKIFDFFYGIQLFVFSSGKQFSILNALIAKFETTDRKIKRLERHNEIIDLSEWKPVYKDGIKRKILVPLQVNNDTQLHVFSKYKSTFEFLSFLFQISDTNFSIDIKLHPAESKRINNLTSCFVNRVSEKYEHIQLVDQADITEYDFVVTINSTFGIDALLNGVKVICFGESLYSDSNFVLNYQEGFSSLSEACDKYDQLVDEESFYAFAKKIQTYFFNFNYFADSITEGISSSKFNESVLRLRDDMSK